ncbi:RNA polymerase sigma factor [Microbacterium esteraromaticum]|uniref:RNA polymerase sigma factor n=1 Tax=Microbacterium esteraromaticum TaxID=57043 RepID=UPI003C2CC90C
MQVRDNAAVVPGDLADAFRQEAPGLLGFFVRRVSPPEDAADLVSETFLAAWRSKQRDAVAPDLRRAWLFGIARKVLSQYRRGRRRRSALSERVRASVGADLAAGGVHPSDEFDPELVEHVRELIRCLSPLDREIIELVYWEGFTQEEVATILGKPSATIRSRLSRARAVLRNQLEESGDIS